MRFIEYSIYLLLALGFIGSALGQNAAPTYQVQDALGNYGNLETNRSSGRVDLKKWSQFRPDLAPFVVRKEIDDWWNSGSALPAFPLRTSLLADGVQFSGSYVADFLGNVSGGLNRAFAYTQTLSAELDLNLEKLVGWEGGTLTWSFADIAGSNLQNAVGNIFTPSNLWTSNSYYFAEFYLEQSLLNGNLVFKLGQLCARNDFAVSPIYGNFLNLAFDGNPFVPFNTFPITGFPHASWGASVKGFLNHDAIANFYGQAGIYQVSNRIGVPGYKGLSYGFQHDDGTMTLSEIGWTPSFFATPAASSTLPDGKPAQSNPGYPGHYKIGAFFTNWTYPTFSGAPNYLNAYGFYFLADQQITMRPGHPSEGLVLWGALSWTPQQNISSLPLFVSGGGQYTGLVPGRSNDITLLGIAYGQGSIDAIRANEQQNFPGSTYEIAVEASYVVRINQWLSVQPDVQYIVNPGGTGTLRNSWILGGQLAVNF